MSEISAAMQELALLEEKRHQQGLTPEEAHHAEQLRAYLGQFQEVGPDGRAWDAQDTSGGQWPEAGSEEWNPDAGAGWPQQASEGWQDPNAQWPQQPGAEDWQQDPDAQWPQQATEGWQDPNAQWQPGAEGWHQDPNAQWPQQSADGWQDPNAQWPQQPGAEGWQDPNAQWPQQAADGWQDPNAQWPQQPGAEGWQDPNAQWPQPSKAEGWQQDPQVGWQPSEAPPEAAPPLQQARPAPVAGAELTEGAQPGSSEDAATPARPEEALPQWPGYEQRPDPSHAWLDEGAPAAPSPWVTAPQAPAEVPPPSAGKPDEGPLDLSGEVDLPALEAPPDWMNSPVPSSPASAGEPAGASLNLGAFEDPSSGAEAAEAPMEIASLSAPISTPVPDGDLALTRSLQDASTGPARADAGAPAASPLDEDDASDDAMEVSDADIIEVADDDVTLIEDDEDEAAEAPPSAPAPRRPIRIAGGLGPTPTPAAATIVPRPSPAPAAAAFVPRPSPAPQNALSFEAPAASAPSGRSIPGDAPVNLSGSSARPHPTDVTDLEASETSSLQSPAGDDAAATVGEAPADTAADDASTDVARFSPAPVQLPGDSSSADIDLAPADGTETSEVAAPSDQPIAEQGHKAAEAVEAPVVEPSMEAAPVPAAAEEDLSTAIALSGLPAPETASGESGPGGLDGVSDAPGTIAPATTGEGSGPATADALNLGDASPGSPDAPDAGAPAPAAEEQVEVASPSEELLPEVEASDDAEPAPLPEPAREDVDVAASPADGSSQVQSAAAGGEAPMFGLPGAVDLSDEAPDASADAAPVVPEDTVAAPTPRASEAVAAVSAVGGPLPASSEPDAQTPQTEGASGIPLPASGPAITDDTHEVFGQRAVDAAASGPAWGLPSEATTQTRSADNAAQLQQDGPEAQTELADDDDSVPVLDLGDLSLASPIPETETAPTGDDAAADAPSLPSEMFEPLQPEKEAHAAFGVEPVGEIELAEDPRVLEVIAQPTEIELKEVALGNGVFGETLDLSEQELIEPEPMDTSDGEVAATAVPPEGESAPSAPVVEAGSDDGAEVELELELSDVEPEPAASSDAAPSAPEGHDDGFDVDLTEGDVEPPPGVYTPSTPPAHVTRFGGPERVGASAHAAVHTERPSIPLPGAADAMQDGGDDLPEAEFELELDEPAFEPEEVEVGVSAEVEIELTEADSAGVEAPSAPELEIELSDVAAPAPSAPLLEPTMEIELVEPETLQEPPSAAPPAPLQPQQVVAPAAASEAWVKGEHRVILHTVEGHVLRGTLRDANLLASEIPLELQPGQPPERVPASRAKAVFFMLSSGQPQPTPEGSKIRITFHDGRQVPGYATAHASDAAGFFVVPVDNRTNTARIFVYRSSIQAISNG